MDGKGFDDLTKKLAQGVSRRSLLKALLGGGAASAALGVLGVRGRARAQVPIGGPCDDVFECFGGLCFARCVNNICEEYCHAEGVGCRNCGSCCPGLVCDTSIDPLTGAQVCVRESPPPPTTPPPADSPPPDSAEAQAAAEARRAAAQAAAEARRAEAEARRAEAEERRRRIR